eukprot:COSAG01_NODE_7416_length_3217_cov_1.389994_1_plen_46_part_00
MQDSAEVTELQEKLLNLGRKSYIDTQTLCVRACVRVCPYHQSKWL